MSKWTGHKAIFFSNRLNEWVEIRSDQNGLLIDTIIQIKRVGNSIRFTWPQRSVTVVFDCFSKAQMNGFHVTEVVVHLPDNRTLSQNSFSVLRRMLSLETNLLKSRLETSYREVPLSDHIHHQVQNYHLNIYAKEKFRVIPTFDIFTRMGFKGEEISDSDTVNLMKTDFAKTIHSTPEIILRPLDPDDLKVVVHLATELGLSITVRGSRVSHSAGGQAQCQHNGILLDMSHFSSITFKNDFCLEVGAGAMWNDVIKTALSQGLMPPVVNDYQYLSVGKL